MQLLHNLAQRGFTWRLEPVSEQNTSKKSSPGLLLSLKAPEAQTTVTKWFPSYTDLTIERMVAVLMKEHFREDPGLREWLNSKGNRPVKLALSEEQLEGIGEPMHVGLRKLADSKQSGITWNSLHHMHPDDRVALWTAVAAYIKTSFENEKTPSLRNLATGLRDLVIETLETQRRVELKDSKGRVVQRLDSEKYAILMMLLGSELTDTEEWMYGWLGYVVTNFEPDEKVIRR